MFLSRSNGPNRHLKLTLSVATCEHVGRPACFTSSLQGFYAFLHSRIKKNYRRKGKKAAGIIKNVAGTKKSPQGVVKMMQD